MPEDVRAALERFQTFLGRFPGGDTIDADSGFTVSDGILLVGEIEMSMAHSDPDEDPID
ncbi:hypothetical protein [Sphingomonas ginsenosidivorax]|uniref:hypothetical protein n=1 Tax=Sphingomonas ginsenosidivorax TaxID=862135 RepID=UPI0018F60A7A|nr:hypothetical protein [Sphingomonas ginsenosidivorax]